MRRALLLLPLLLGVAVSAAAPAEPPATPPAATATPAVKRGYWFYERKPEAAPEPPTVQAEPVTALAPPPPEAELLKMHPTQVAKLIESYRQYALFTMQPEQVRWYFQLQDFARRRSRAFMNVTEMVMLENPGLNMNSVYPVNQPGTNARVAQREATIQQRLERERDRAALVLLTSASCGFCEAQRGILKFFQERHPGWQVREYDLAERPDIAAKFGTSTTPTTMVIFRDTGDWYPVAVGVEAVPRLEENTYRAIRRLHGETSPEQFTMQETEDGGILDPQRR